MASAVLPGMLVASRRDGSDPHKDVEYALARIGVSDATMAVGPAGILASWGMGPSSASGEPLLLSLTNWHHNGSVPASQIARWLADGSLRSLDEMLPPFGAVGNAGGGLRIIADRMGFRQIFRLSGERVSAVSTSARALSAIGGMGLDKHSVALQSQLGWQLGQATLFEGVTKLSPGEGLRLGPTGTQSESIPEPEVERLPLDEAVRRAAVLLREFLARYLDENADPVLQLTGGQDSRLLLSAIPIARRRGLKVMTVGGTGNADVDLAAGLSKRYGMHHIVKSLAGLTSLTPGECYELAWEAAERLDCMADPIARAATLWAERSIEQGARLSGLGGEIARGFYYTGRVRPTPVTRRRSEQLARWRMFANEPAEPKALAGWLSKDALAIGIDAVHEAISEGGTSWYEATDELYYRHRMQRWAGLGESAVCFDRALTNPMLDHRYIEIARGLAPKDKQRSIFLARLQVALDEDLADTPLNGRPPPRSYAEPSLTNFARLRASTLQATARKVRQRALHERRPPAGGTVVASRLTEHFRTNRDLLDPVFESGVFAESWLSDVLSGRVKPAPSSLALVMNILVASLAPPPG